MPSQFGWRKHYNVDDEDDDDGDKVVPIHCEEAFRNGLTFKAKFIGSMVVPRPTRRMEIVVAMRQVRYNTKAKQTAKVKCLATISVKGVRSIRRPSKKKKNMKEEECIVGGHEIVMMNDPIYRIFYVSHDSHDLNVWSYIARDAASNTFRCNVFKCTRKSKAMKVVRTIGQAFEVCHKITQHQQHVLTGMDVYERIRSKKDHQLTPLEQHAIKIAEIHGWRIKPANLATSQSVAMETDIDAPPTTTATPVTMETDLDAVTTTTPGSERRREKPRISTDLDRVTRSVTSAAGSKTTSSSTRKVKRKSSSHASSAVKTTTTTSNNKMNNSNNNSSNKSFSTQQHIKLLQQQAQLADQQAQIAANQVKQLRVQLKLEMNARSETQARNHRLLVQNRELIQQLSELVTFVKMSEAQQQQQQQQQEEDVNTTANSTDVSGENSNNSDLPGMISLSNLQQMITESEARPCTTVIANDRLDSSSVSTDIDRMKQERRNGISGHSYFTSSSDDSSLQTLTNRLSESHPGSCSSDSSTSSDEDDHFINEMKSHHLGEIQCNGNISFENEEEYEGRKSDDKLDSFSDTSISALTEDDSSNQQQQKPSTPLDETSVWTTGNSSSHFETSQQETDDDKKSTDNSFTLSPIPKSQFTDVTPLNFEESFVVSRLNTDLDHGSFSDLRKLENDPIVADITTVATTTSNQESKNEPLEASAMEYMLSAAQQVETAQLSNGSIATSSYYFNSLETNFDDNSNYKQHSLQESNNNNSTNPFRTTTTTTNNIFSEPAIFESELRYEPLRKVQAAERWRGSQVFTSLTSAITVDHSSANEEPSLNSFLDTVDTSSSSTTVSMTTTNVYRHQHNK